MFLYHKHTKQGIVTTYYTKLFIIDCECYKSQGTNGNIIMLNKLEAVHKLNVQDVIC